MGRVFADEIQTPEQGAPQGPPFEVEVPSSSTPGKTYRISRSHSGDLIHPGCPAFRFRKACRHIERALALAERPAETLVEDLMAAWHAGGWREENRSEYAATAFRAARAAKDQLDNLASWERYQAEREAERVRLEAMSDEERRAEAEKVFERLSGGWG